METRFEPGALVRARNREWVVVGRDETTDTLVLRPLGGSDDECAGIYLGSDAQGVPFERVDDARFAWPDPERDLGNFWSCRLLRDAARISVRASAGPFRSLARISVEPRPYQLVPLMMALRQDTVRLMIADDVGVGKTVEAALIARELWDRGEVRSVGVLCPPHLAEQWEQALRTQFHFEPTLVLASTAPRLERNLGGRSLFEEHPVVVISTDFIKQERRREEFVRTCPELIIVDEAHGCADTGGRGAGQKRHELLQRIAQNRTRHMLLVTATPHSGVPGAFRSLLALLDPALAELPDDLTGDAHRADRERLARFLVQRRRNNLRDYLSTDTPFPTREVGEHAYALEPGYRKLLDDLVAFCGERVYRADLDERRRRIQWWSALAMLRAFSSSPAALVATLRTRAGFESAESPDEVDAEARPQVGDDEEFLRDGTDAGAGAATDIDEKDELAALAGRAAAFEGKGDRKLKALVSAVEGLLKEGFAPIVFCRFIATAEYVARELRKELKKLEGLEIAAVTGAVASEQRTEMVEQLGRAARRVLVCTDCLSEGINLQRSFDAVVHYDLAWNPTRHEQREGRVDRFGQPRPRVRALSIVGRDNPVDGIVLEVLVRKRKQIEGDLGVLVPVPEDERIIEWALFEGLLLRKGEQSQRVLPYQMNLDTVALKWTDAVEREKRSRAVFAQNPLHATVEKSLGQELAQVRRALGTTEDVTRFVRMAFDRLGIPVSGSDPITVSPATAPSSLRDALGTEQTFTLAFSSQTEGPTTPRATRASPCVAGLAGYVLERALDAAGPDTPVTDAGPARRCGAIFTKSVDRRTTLLLLRVRAHLVGKDRARREHTLLAEEVFLAGFRGTPAEPEWLDEGPLEALLDAPPSRDVLPEAAAQHVRRVLDAREALSPKLEALAKARGDALLEAHQRVRKATSAGEYVQRVEVHLPADVLAVYVLLPDGTGAAR